MKRFLVLAGALLLLAGCARSPQPDDSHPQAWLKPGVRVTLPPPGSDPGFSEQQLLTGTFRGKQQSLLVLLSATPQRIDLAGLSPLGIRLFRLGYDASGIHREQSIVLPQMPPASQVLADVMLSRWPVSVWQGHLPAGWQLADSGDRRRLTDGHGALIVEIRYLQRGNLRLPVAIQQYAFGYSIAINYLD